MVNKKQTTSKRLERTLNENNIAFKVSENVEEGKANIIVSSEGITVVYVLREKKKIVML